MSCVPCNNCPPELSYVLPNCPGGEPCEEVSLADCISYKGPNLPALGVSNMDRLSSVLTSLHKAINSLMLTPIPVASYTATNTLTGANAAPLVVTYLGLGPVYTSTPGATSTASTITVGSTTGLEVGMSLEITAGTGTLAPNTTVTAVVSPTTFTVSAQPSVALSGATVKATGSDHQIFTISVVPGTPQTFKAFVGSHVKLSGTGTIV